VCLPLTILNLMILGPLASFLSARPCVLMDRIDPVGIAAWVRDERITSFAAVPTILHDLLTHPDVDRDDLATLTRPGVGGANCPQHLRDVYADRFGRRVASSYGLTEAPTAVTIEDTTRPPVQGSSGRALPHLSVSIRTDDGAELPAGEIGEICVGRAEHGPFAGVYTPMLGYWRQPDATRAAFHDAGQVLRTGDLGYLSADGDLFVTDRKNDVIVRGGANVYPAEIERVLAEIPGVAECAVVGVPDDRLGERVVAALVLEKDTELSSDELRRRCTVSLARYKVPEEFVFVDDLPRNAMGKVVKRHVVSVLER
jgi:acyl-CoA synthetase (AMP-forming)/AMP-acid ligase II